LLANALKYTQAGFLKINIKDKTPKTWKEADTRKIEFSVVDSGEGIPEKNFGELFKVLGRIDHENYS